MSVIMYFSLYLDVYSVQNKLCHCIGRIGFCISPHGVCMKESALYWMQK